MFGLNYSGARPWGHLTRMKFSRSNEFGISATIRSVGKTLNGDPQQALAQKDDQPFKLVRAEIFIGIFHSIVLFESPSLVGVK